MARGPAKATMRSKSKRRNGIMAASAYHARDPVDTTLTDGPASPDGVICGAQVGAALL
jgi:hypothetical protein